MFTFRSLLSAFRRAQPAPYDAAVQALAHGRNAEALVRLDELAADPQIAGELRAAICNKRGVALMSLERREEARLAFEEALKALPRYAPALVNAGNLHLEAGEIESALASYERAIAADDGYAPAYHNSAVAYKRLGKTAEAVRALRRAHRLEARR